MTVPSLPPPPPGCFPFFLGPFFPPERTLHFLVWVLYDRVLEVPLCRTEKFSPFHRLRLPLALPGSSLTHRLCAFFFLLLLPLVPVSPSPHPKKFFSPVPLLIDRSRVCQVVGVSVVMFAKFPPLLPFLLMHVFAPCLFPFSIFTRPQHQIQGVSPCGLKNACFFLPTF